MLFEAPWRASSMASGTVEGALAEAVSDMPRSSTTSAENLQVVCMEGWSRLPAAEMLDTASAMLPLVLRGTTTERLAQISDPVGGCLPWPSLGRERSDNEPATGAFRSDRNVQNSVSGRIARGVLGVAWKVSFNVSRMICAWEKDGCGFCR